jgi:hypothetical protein
MVAMRDQSKSLRVALPLPPAIFGQESHQMNREYYKRHDPVVDGVVKDWAVLALLLKHGISMVLDHPSDVESSYSCVILTSSLPSDEDVHKKWADLVLATVDSISQVVVIDKPSFYFQLQGVKDGVAVDFGYLSTRVALVMDSKVVSKGCQRVEYGE